MCCHSRQQAEQVKARLAGWLEPRGPGLQRGQDPDRAASTEGFDFLGFNLRRYPNGKLLIRPGAAAIKRFRDRLADGDARTARRQRGGGPREDQPDRPGLGRLLPGSGVVQDFAALTDYLWKLTYKWACWSHANKPKRWIVAGTTASSTKFRNDRWVFGNRDTGAYLPKLGLDRYRPA